MKLRKSIRLIPVLLVLMLLITGCAGQKMLQHNGDTGNSGNAESSGNSGGPEDTGNAEKAGDTENTGNVGDAGDTGNTDAGNTDGSQADEADAVENDPVGGDSGNGDSAASEQGTPTPGNKNVKVKALYLTGWTVGGSQRLEHYVEMANATEINAYVVDIKDDDGYVGYESQVPEVRENNTWKKKYDPDKVLKAFHDNDIYVIGRLVVFKDPVYSVKRPDLAIKHINGGLYKDKDGISWLNPYNKETWDYTVSIAKEAVAKGFDEIQFDYIRYPGDYQSKMDFSGIEEEKYEAINEFLAYAKEQIPEVPISADVFGIILESPNDTEKIGQYLELIGMDIDYISPMVYPSHYALGQIVNKVRFAVPDLEPYGVVYNSLVKCKNRLTQVEGYKAKVRPYLQDFTATWLKSRDGKTKYYQEYGPEQVRQQIQAVYDAGYEEWILWDARNTYSEEALLKE